MGARKDPLGIRRGGFTLLELVVVMVVLSILAGVAVPLSVKLVNSKARSATESELRGLTDAAAEFFRDTQRLPSAIDQLVRDPGLAGWTGPYLAALGQDKLAAMGAHLVDGWSRPYALSVAGDVWTLSSAGSDGQAGNADDVRLDLDVTWIRREVTLKELAVINQAVALYNAQYMATNPLPLNWRTALAQLVARRFLPTAAPYQQDGWNQAYVPDPAGRLPVVKITSVNLR